MAEEQLYDKIEAYLLGELPPGEAEAFARQVEDDPALADQVELHRLEHDAMEVLLERELRNDVLEWIREVKESDATGMGGTALPVPEEGIRPQAIPMRRWLWLAAILVGAALVSILFIWQPWLAPSSPAIEQQEPPPVEAPSPEQGPVVQTDGELPVAEQQSPAPKKETPVSEPQQQRPEPKPGLLALADEVFDDPFSSELRGRPDSPPSAGASLYVRAVAAYKTGKYERTRQLARQVPDTDADYGDARLLIGMSFYRQGRYQDAATAFRRILIDEAVAPDDDMLRDLIRQSAEWNLMVSLLAQGPPTRQAAGQLLDKITGEADHGFQQKAQEVRNRLQKINR